MKLNLTIILITILVIGWILGFMFAKNLIKTEDNYIKKLDGSYLRNYNLDMVKNYTHKKDLRGDWVLINIRNMNYERAVEVCKHEVGHEIFAEVCEKNITKCLDVMN